MEAAEKTKLKNLEIQVENGGGGAWDYLCLVRKLKARRSDKVFKYGLSILNDPKSLNKLGAEEWTLYEQVAVAAMDCQDLDMAKDCIKNLRKKFPDSTRVGRLEGMFLEARESWADAENAYSRLLEDNPLDQVVHKRKVAMAKAQGNLSGAIESLNKYLEIFMADHDAWRELAELYVTLQMYKQAAFCYEELLLCQPTVPLYHLAYAEEIRFICSTFAHTHAYAIIWVKNPDHVLDGSQSKLFLCHNWEGQAWHVDETTAPNTAIWGFLLELSVSHQLMACIRKGLYILMVQDIS